MDREPKAVLTHGRDAETAEELVGVLTAISLVSKRLARKLMLLEQQSAESGGAKSAGKTMSAHGD